jgi:Icc-related predicted phosphoesterase
MRLMRVLALADRPFHADVAKLASRCDVEAIVTLGDLQPSWLETLDKVYLPKLGVYGNHDDEPYMTWFGIDDVHVNRIDLDNGVSFSGFEGCVSYRRSGTSKVGPSYTQRQAKKLVRKLPPADVLLCHCPPRGVNDDPDDPAHIGYEALRPWVLKHQPRWLLHGHTHPMPGSLLTQIGDTRVVYVNGARVIDLT